MEYRFANHVRYARELEEPGNPFRLFDLRTGVDTVDDPYPEWHAVRRHCPVAHGNLHSALGPVRAMGRSAPVETFSAHGYEAVSTVLRDHATFSSSIHSTSIGKIFGSM